MDGMEIKNPVESSTLGAGLEFSPSSLQEMLRPGERDRRHSRSDAHRAGRSGHARQNRRGAGDGEPDPAVAESSVLAGTGRPYVADGGNRRIRSVDLDDGTIITIAGTGDPEFSGELLDAGATSLSGPRGVAVSPFGLLFIGDPGHDIAWRVALDF